MRSLVSRVGKIISVGIILGICGGAAPPVGTIKLIGKVVMPDGSPVVDATVTSLGMNGNDVTAQTHTDSEGRFELVDMFGFGCRLHVSAKDARHQAVVRVEASLARKKFSMPVEIVLQPARKFVVAVNSDGQLANNVRVVAIGTGSLYQIHEITESDGRASLWLPTDEKLSEIHAWHPTLGIGGNYKIAEMGNVDEFALTLLAPSSHTVRVIDTEGNGVAGMRLGMNVLVDRTTDWICAQKIEESHLYTNKEGMATVPWFPKGGARHVDLGVIETDWKMHEVEPATTAEDTTIVHVRRRYPVIGRIVMSEGHSADGILITGSGFGPTEHGDGPVARARSDGSFELRVPSDHAYALGILDRDWASDLWTGVILADDSSAPAEIVLHAYPATTVQVRVTRGPDRSPVANAWVSTRTEKEISWRDSTGERRRGSTGTSGWLRTDSDGFAETGVGKGELHLRMSSGKWQEERIVEVKSDEPISVEFHRPWYGERKFAVRLTDNGTALAASTHRLINVLTLDEVLRPTRVEPVVLPDGSFEVAIDAPNLMVLAVDSDKHRSGFKFVGPEDSNVELPMIEAAAYRGVLVDDKGKPMPGRKVRLTVSAYNKVTANGKTFRRIMAGDDDLAAEEQITDEQGEFEFETVAANLSLMLRVEKEEDERKFFSSLGERFFFPGELREDDRVVVESENTRDVKREVPLGERIADTVETVGPVGMHALVLLQGDDTRNVTAVTERLVDHDEVRAILGYLPLTVEAKDVEREVAELEKRDWERPQTGEIALVALDGRGELLDMLRIATGDAEEALASGAEFLKTHAPSVGDALEKITQARAEAESSERHVWIVYGGPRCGPCFRLARWMKEHHELVEKDYVIVKVMGGWDQHVDEVLEQLSRPSGGIPWMAITDSEGSILVTSDGPLGNIGFPGRYESIRHFREMLERTSQRLTEVEIEVLVGSLEKR